MGVYQRLEHEYAAFTGASHAVSCNTGTAALHLALLALGIGKGDEVIVPDFTMAACGFSVAYTGAKPVFVDCTDKLLIDTKRIEEKITPLTKAIMVVHIYGRLVNMREVMRIARKHHLWVIEDACEAQGAIVNSPAHITCYSFFKNKIIHAEEGGMCTTDRKWIAERMNYLKNMAFSPEHDYFHAEIGFNYRMPDSEAALALQSLHEYKRNARKRRLIESWYDSVIPKKYRMPKRDAVWVYDTKLLFKDIPGSRHFFKPLSSFPMWRQESGEKAHKYSKFMYLPVNPTMTKAEVLKLAKSALP